MSKTPTQVASHAQKYYLRQLSGGKDKRRPSIHDITTVHLSDRQPAAEKSTHQIISATSGVQSSSSPRIVMDWNQKNEAAAALMACGDSFLDIAKINGGHCVFNIGASAPGFYIKSPRFYG